MVTPQQVACRVQNGSAWPWLYLLLAAGLALSVLPLGGSPKPILRYRLFPQSGLRVDSPFLEWWELPRSYGASVAVNGLPLSPLQPAPQPPGAPPHMVQWFERARYELHPEEAPPNDVQFGALGREMIVGREGEAPFLPVPQPQPADPQVYWFPETQHTLRGPLLQFWLKYGSWKQFGFAISEPFTEQQADGHTYMMQWFERARLEIHPGEAPEMGDVIVARLGAELYKP